MSKALIFIVLCCAALSALIQVGTVEPQPHPSITFGLGLVYTTTGLASCSGPRPTVVLSTRHILNGVYSEWIQIMAYTDQGCNYEPNITLPYTDFARDNYRFSVQISCADQCHCVTIGNTTQSYGDRIRAHWSTVWRDVANDSLLCANSQQQGRIVSNTFRFSVDSDQINVINFNAAKFDHPCSTDILSSFLEEELQSTRCLSSMIDSMPITTPSSPLPPNTSPIMQFDEEIEFSSTAQVSFTPSSTVQHISTTVENPTSSTIYTSSTTDLSSTIMPSPSSTISTDYSSSIKNHSMPQSLASLSMDNILSSDSSVSSSSTGVSTPAFHITSTQISVSPTRSVYCPAEQGVWNRTLACEQSRSVSACPNIPIKNVTRECLCNGTWGPDPCQTTLSKAEDLISMGKAEEGLKALLILPPNSINNTQRLEVLTSAFQAQSAIKQQFNTSFAKTAIEIVNKIPIKSASKPLLLNVLDMIALNLKRNITIFSEDGSIVLRVREVIPGSGRLLGIQVDNNYISLPGELFENLKRPVFVASFHFKNISSVLPEGDPISPVISSILSCTDCRTSNLTENVTIFFDLPPKMNNDTVECAFVDLSNRVNKTNFWNTSGCMTVEYENGSVMCSCNHLTHFAILLGPGVEIPPVHQKVLTVIGQVFVSISLVFLLATILTFVLQKSLWNMRNYIHCMLCANLIAAQLVFVVGVERNENEAVCSTIAVLLHYLFLVVFMWMLMEGVVLYLVLVKVFVKHQIKRYIIAFTISSYGIPFLYTLVVVPLGFLVNTDSTGHHYGQYNTHNKERLVCWLRYDTHFIWAFIAPVILIILVNIGFLIMAIAVLYHVAKEKNENKFQHEAAKYWIKVVTTLVVVMGIAWIGNVLFFSIHLLFVAYIMTIFIASQGIIIFILFVPLSKQVRDAYKIWWRKQRKLSSAATFSLSESLQTKQTMSKKSFKEDESESCNGNNTLTR